MTDQLPLPATLDTEEVLRLLCESIAEGHRDEITQDVDACDGTDDWRGVVAEYADQIVEEALETLNLKGSSCHKIRQEVARMIEEDEPNPFGNLDEDANQLPDFDPNQLSLPLLSSVEPEKFATIDCVGRDDCRCAWCLISLLPVKP